MILNRDSKPDEQIYYLGGLTIEKLKLLNSDKIDFLDLYSQINKDHKITLNKFILVIDWLYLLGVIAKGKEGLVKCF